MAITSTPGPGRVNCILGPSWARRLREQFHVRFQCAYISLLFILIFCPKYKYIWFVPCFVFFCVYNPVNYNTCDMSRGKGLKAVRKDFTGQAFEREAKNEEVNVKDRSRPPPPPPPPPPPHHPATYTHTLNTHTHFPPRFRLRPCSCLVQF